MYEQTLTRFMEAGYSFQSVEEAEGATWRDLLFAVASGQGITFAPASLEDESLMDIMVVRRDLDPPLRGPATLLAWRGDALPGLRMILGTAREVARQLRASSAPGEAIDSG